jgi:PPOX class probable F420-dependent enzyme
MAMSVAELRAFLNRPLVGVVATTRADGAPHAVPVWYRYDEEAVHIWTDEARLWVRNVGREGRAAFCVHESEPPYAAVIMRGAAEAVTGGEEVMLEIYRIARRYLDEREVDRYVETQLGAHLRGHERWSGLRTVVTIRAHTVHSWSVGY